MKRFFCLLAVLAAAGACNKADWTGNTPVGTPVSSLTVSSGPVTRTATDGSLQIRWTAGDQIAVYGNQLEEDEVATPFTITGEGGSSTATFAGNPATRQDSATLFVNNDFDARMQLSPTTTPFNIVVSGAIHT